MSSSNAEKTATDGGVESYGDCGGSEEIKDPAGNRVSGSDAKKEGETRWGDVLHLGLSTGSDAKILVVGDGDFSYSRALMRILAPINLIATSYDTSDELKQKYPHCAEILSDLNSLNVALMHGVDARKLEEKFPQGKFERIVFMFPQSPPKRKGRNKIQLHRALIAEFLQSAVHVLAPNGRIYITLLQGQGGTTVENAPRGYLNSWWVNQAAANAGCLIASVHKLDSDSLHEKGYISRGYMDSSGQFLHPLNISNPKKRRKKEGFTHVIIPSDGVTPGIDSPDYTFDNSFWVKDDFDEKEFQAFIKDNIAPTGVIEEISNLDTYKDPESARVAKTYRFRYRDLMNPIGKKAAGKLNEKVRAMIKDSFAVGEMR